MRVPELHVNGSLSYRLTVSRNGSYLRSIFVGGIGRPQFEITLFLPSVLISLLLCCLLSDKREDVLTCKFFKLKKKFCTKIPRTQRGTRDAVTPCHGPATQQTALASPSLAVCASRRPTAAGASPPASRRWPSVPKEPQNCYWLNHRVVKAVIEISKAVLSVTFDLQLHQVDWRSPVIDGTQRLILELWAHRVSPQLTDVIKLCRPL